MNTNIWRSMLFIPAHNEKFVERAHTRGADAYILDLEDAVPLAEKPRARDLLSAGVQQIKRGGAAALVRINAEPALAKADLEAACIEGIAALVIPKVNSAAEINAVAKQVDFLESMRGLPANAIRLIAQIEDVRALPVLDEIAASSKRLLGMILGPEDFSASAGMEPFPEALFAPNQQIVFACRRAALLPFGFPASIADYSDLDAFRAHIRRGRRMGFVGAFCIHPAQVAILNEEFSPAAAEIETARGVIAAYELALNEGKGTATYSGKMIDLPVVLRARETLRRAGLFVHDAGNDYGSGHNNGK